MKVVAVKAGDVTAAWPFVRELLKPAIAATNGKITEKDVMLDCMDDFMQLWTVVDKEIVAVVVTQIYNTPQKKICRVILCGGNGVEKWWRRLSAVEKWAKAVGCDLMQIVGRPGWERILEQYNKADVVLEKELWPLAKKK